MEIDQLERGVVSVRLAGEFDLVQAYAFDEQVRAVEEQHPDVIVVDLRQVTFVDSAGLARILAARRRAQRAGRRFAVVRGCRAVERLFALTALDAQLDMVAEPEAVLAGR
jgi:anti-sigma B factor antagonist